MNLRKWLLFFFITSIVFSACEPDEVKHKDIPDVSNIQVNLEIQRFEKDLFAMDTSNLDIGMGPQVEQIQQKYPNFFEVFSTNILVSPLQEEIPVAQKMEEFVKHPSIQKLYEQSMQSYDDVSDIEADLEEAFKYHKYYFPERPVPKVVSFISEYVVGTFTYGDSLLAIGWDFFLGKDFHYDTRIFPAHIQRSMDKKHLVAKAIETLASNIVGEPKEKKMLDIMISNGKILYIKSLLLPHLPDSILMEYTPEQMKWTEDNEKELWAYFLRDNLLYSTQLMKFQKLVGASPKGTSEMPPESPGKTANWVAWQMVKMYMDNQPNLSLEDLVAEQDAQLIMQKSRYKPKR